MMTLSRNIGKGVFILALFGAAFLLGLVIMDRIVMPIVVGHGQEVIVPDITERSKNEARKVLDEVGLRIVLETEIFDPVVPEGYIVSQKPQAYSKVKKGRRIRVVISKGSEQLTVPDLIRGISLRTAEIELKSAGFDLGTVMYRASDEFHEEVVIAQSPLPNAVAPRGALISLTVSSGPLSGYALMPDLVGLSAEAAIAELRESGLETGEIVYVKRDDLLPETVVEQSVDVGTDIVRGSRIDLTVSQ